MSVIALKSQEWTVTTDTVMGGVSTLSIIEEPEGIRSKLNLPLGSVTVAATLRFSNVKSSSVTPISGLLSCFDCTVPSIFEKLSCAKLYEVPKKRIKPTSVQDLIIWTL